MIRLILRALRNMEHSVRICAPQAVQSSLDDLPGARSDNIFGHRWLVINE